MNEEKSDNVITHPPHYTAGKYEVIDIIEDATKDASGIEAFCQANILKYIMRYQHKNGTEDVKKVIWYAQKLVDVLEARE